MPGEAADAVLAITFEGLTQTVSLTDGTLESEATAYYDGYTNEGWVENLPTVKAGTKGEGLYAEFELGTLLVKRTAYEEKAGWAPEGKAWLVFEANPKAPVFETMSRPASETATWDTATRQA